MSYLPDAFIQHLCSQSLKSSEVDAFIASCNTPLRKSVRVNEKKCSVEQFQQLAKQLGWHLEPIPWCSEGFWIQPTDTTDEPSFGNRVEHLQGLFYIQEASSMLPAMAMKQALASSQLVLDMAAAPGSKTTQIANYTPHGTTVVANELSSSRVKVLHANLIRCGISDYCLTHYDATIFGNATPNLFDAVLLDAPCGGEGTIRKDPDALKNWSLEALETISNVQKQLIISAYQSLKPGGTLVYSTCTLSKEENQEVCEYLLNHAPEMTTVPLTNLFPGAENCATDEGYLHLFPHIFDCEGFFVAAFKKSVSTACQPLQKTPSRKPKFSPLSKKRLSELNAYLNSQFGFDTAQLKHSLWEKNDTIWYLPDAMFDLSGYLKVDRAGIKVADIHKNGLRLHHDFAISFGQQFGRNRVKLTPQQAADYLQGKDIHDITVGESKGECLLVYRDAPLGLGKTVNNRIKNSLPRALVRDNAFA